MRRPGAVLLTCVALGALIVIGAGLQGAARFTGVRGLPDFSLPEPTGFPRDSRMPFNTRTPLPAQQDSTPGSFDIVVILWVLVGIAVVLGLALLVRWLARRPARSAVGVNPASLDAVQDVVGEPLQAAPRAPVLRRGLRRAIDALEAEREPHDAIVKAWLGMQEAAGESGIRRRAAETPTEFTSRILARVPADAASVTTLLNIYLRVRFGDHPVTARDVAAVREVLTALARSWDAALDAAVTAPPWEHTSRDHTS